ncbi:hypothetical protein [Actinomadura rudentiformis]|nr:hypothetical protein [Actinomadura rudentiformis]
MTPRGHFVPQRPLMPIAEVIAIRAGGRISARATAFPDSGTV